MVRYFFIALLTLSLGANDLFDKKCAQCHLQNGKSLKAIFFNYLLYYSSERGVKKAMKEQLLHPDPQKSLVNKKILYKHTIDPNELDILLQIYWNRYKVIGKIK